MPIKQITHAELQAMIGRDAEGVRLEFKVDIPVHKQSQKDQATKNTAPARDAWWYGKPLGAHGRDKLLEEVVAFANAQGGQLFLGMDEEDGTTLAKAICPLPRIADLEGRFRDCLLSCVEPRLPQIGVRAIETDGQGGGVLVIEVQPSRLGPHRVTGTLQVPIRRGDKCMPTTMAEVHEMVLRNARRFDEVRATLASQMEDLEPAFRTFLTSKTGTFNAYGIRIAICAHDDLGIPRLPKFDPLIPPATCIKKQTAQGPAALTEIAYPWSDPCSSERFLGGVRQVSSSSWDHGYSEFRALREGVVRLTFFFVDHPDKLSKIPLVLAAYLGWCMGIYDRLRNIAERPTMPAEVAISVLTRGVVRVADGNLPESSSPFPRRTIADATDCTELLNITVQDLLDAANVHTLSPDRFVYSPF
ncbi:MAG: ATP-binding protein [Acidobacteriaceae bacterium]